MALLLRTQVERRVVLLQSCQATKDRILDGVVKSCLRLICVTDKRVGTAVQHVPKSLERKSNKLLGMFARRTGRGLPRDVKQVPAYELPTNPRS